MRRWLGAGLAVLCGLLAGGASAEAAPTLSATYERGDLRTDPAPAGFGDAFAGHDPASAAAATRALLSALTGVPLPDWRARAAAASAGDGAVQSLREAVGTPDLDGDGRPDVLSVEVSFEDYLTGDFTYGVTALASGGGRVLWSRESAEAFDVLPLAPGDLTGDGRGDVVLLRLADDVTAAKQCGSQACAGAEGGSHSWTVEVISGADGSTAWQRTLAGNTARAYAGGALFPPGVLTSDNLKASTNIGVVVLPAGDHDGDGAPDLVLNAFDVVSAQDYQYLTPGSGIKSFAEARPSLIRTRAEVVSGAGGDTLLSREQAAWSPRGGLLSAAGDATGDDREDLLWQSLLDVKTAGGCLESAAADGCAGTERMVLDLELVDGVSLATSWTRRLEDPRAVELVVRPARGDLNGDGRDDLLQWQETDFEGERTGWSMHMLDGTSGVQRWRRDAQGHPDALDGSILGAIGGGAGSDVLVFDIDIRHAGAGYEAIAHRVDGATGKQLLTTRGVYEREEYTFWVALGGDSNDDAVRDLVFSTVFSDTSVSPSRLTSTATVESGADGAQIDRRRAPGTVHTVPAGDLDGDGRDDVLALVLPLAEAPVRVTARSIPGGDVLWARAGEFTGLTVGTIGADVLVSRLQGDYRDYRSRIDLIDGRTGTSRWGHGDPLGSTPAAVHLVASGPGAAVDEDADVTLSGTADASGFCLVGPIRIHRAGSDTPVALVQPDEHGRWSAPLARRSAGRFRATVPADGECAAGESEELVVERIARATEPEPTPTPTPTPTPSPEPTPTPDAIPSPTPELPAAPSSPQPATTPKCPKGARHLWDIGCSGVVVGARARVARRWLELQVRCVGEARCAGRVAVRGVGSRRVVIRGGRSAKVRLRLSSAARRRAIRAGRVVVTFGGGSPVTVRL